MTGDSETQTEIVRRQLAELRAPQREREARAALLELAGRRLRRLASRMLDDYSRVRRYEETDDVMQNALLRLDRALSAVAPASEADFFRLAAAQIRRELIDLARHHFGAEGAGAHESPMPSATESCPEPLAVADTTHMPSKLAAWAELHERVAALPAEQRDLFDLLWYQELTQPEAAELLGVPLRTLKRQWQAVRRTLADQLGDSLPF